jgi:hypothetical protein
MGVAGRKSWAASPNEKTEVREAEEDAQATG